MSERLGEDRDLISELLCLFMLHVVAAALEHYTAQPLAAAGLRGDLSELGGAFGCVGVCVGVWALGTYLVADWDHAASLRMMIGMAPRVMKHSALTKV